MFGQVDVVGLFRWVDDSIGTLFECCFKLFVVSPPILDSRSHDYQGNNVCRLRGELVC